jgi:probable HAF family extracellular repeat protein
MLLPLGGAVLAICGMNPRLPAQAAVSSDPFYLPTPITSARLRLTPAALNDSGQVVGRVDGYGAPIARPFLWQNGQAEVLQAGDGSVVTAAALNNNGLIAGSSDAVSAKQWHPVFWESGVLVDLGFMTITPAGFPVGLFGVNEQEQAVGGSGHAFLRTGSVTTDLGTLGGERSVAYALNEQGQVVGAAEIASGSTRAFLWKDGAMQDLGTLGGDFSAAYDLNEAGQVVGTSSLASGAYHAFLWKEGVMRDLGALPAHHYSVAQAINDAGQIVGSSRRFQSDVAGGTGVLWTVGGIRTLSGLVQDRSPWRITDARDVNNRGQIAAQGSHLGATTGVLLSPVVDDLTASWSRVNVKYRGIRAPRTTLEGDLSVRNGGTRRVGLITVKLYLSHDAQLDASDLQVARKRISLPPAGQTVVKLSKKLTRGQEISGLRLLAYIDADDVYREEDETNNFAVSSPLP